MGNGESWIHGRVLLHNDASSIKLSLCKKAHPLAAQQKAVVSQFWGVPFDIKILDIVTGVKIFNYTTGKMDVYSGKDIKLAVLSGCAIREQPEHGF